VLSRVWAVNRELVVRGLLDVVSRDPDVLNLVMRLPEGLNFLLVLPLRIALSAACVAAAANPAVFNLEKCVALLPRGAGADKGPQVAFGPAGGGAR
jgi:hypothetical protein